MSNETLVAPVASKPEATWKPKVKREDKIPFYTLPKMIEYYNNQMDKKFQKRGEDVEQVQGHDVFYKLTSIHPEYSPTGPRVDADTVTEVQAGFNPDGSPKMIPDVMPYRVKYHIAKGYTVVTPGGGPPVFNMVESKATDQMLAALFLEDFEEYSSE